MSGHRLATGGRIDRATTLPFTFDRRALTGHAGDTLASALLANGIDVIARSFKLHRPRGFVSAGIDEPNGFVQLVAPYGAPNVLATTLPLAADIAARSLHGWPGTGFDLGAIADLLHPLLPAGFYYKTFMSPPSAWPWYERLIRRAAGLGRVPAAPAPVCTERRFAHCDVLVVGAGPAGLMAALAAATSGLRVILADAQPTPGGLLSDHRWQVEGDDAAAWAMQVALTFDAMPGARRLSRTTVTGCHGEGFFTAVEQEELHFERLWKIRARQVVLAAGAFERPMLFPDNDQPGVMLLSGVSAFAHRYGVAAGRRVVVIACHADAYAQACALRDAGVHVAALVDVRDRVPARLVEDASTRGIEVIGGQTIVKVHGDRRVTAITVAPLDALHAERTIDCDTIAMSAGWQPTLHLHSQAGGRMRFDPRVHAFVPEAPLDWLRTAGSVNGTASLGDCLREGLSAGQSAAGALGRPIPEVRLPHVFGDEPLDLAAVAELPNPRRRRVFVDFQHDVTTDDLRLAAREGYRSIEHAKRYTTAGMGVDQGKSAHLNVALVQAPAARQSPSTLPTLRPPFTPMAFGTIAAHDPGPLVRPTRETPMSAWHRDHGAVMYESGANWRRPGYYPRAGESMASAVARECRAVREGVGIYDSSPLGKVLVDGPDAAAFLDRVYATRVGNLAPGRGRYALMLREDGRLFDDGVVFRLAADRFWITTTTGNADAALAWLEYLLQCVWPMRVFLTPVSAQWANAVVCGPLARVVLQTAGTDIDLAPGAFPFMAVREGTVAGLPARVFRVSFTGEVSYEVNVRARDGLALWEALIEAGRSHGIEPVGSEANHVLRIEKGYLSTGHEVDGMADPLDLGLDRFITMDKPDFIGRRSLEVFRNGPRRELVGLLSTDPATVLPEGAQVLVDAETHARGFVTAAVASPALGRAIALALLDDGRARMGHTVRITMPRGETTASVVAPVFFDPAGERLRG